MLRNRYLWNKNFIIQSAGSCLYTFRGNSSRHPISLKNSEIPRKKGPFILGSSRHKMRFYFLFVVCRKVYFYITGKIQYELLIIETHRIRNRRRNLLNFIPLEVIYGFYNDINGTFQSHLYVNSVNCSSCRRS